MAGTIRKRGENSYLLEYMCEGERYWQTVKAKTDTEAKKLLTLFVAEVEKGNFNNRSSLTFVELAQLFLDKYAKDNLSPTTITDYKNRLNKHILNEFGIKKINRIKRIQIQEFANRLVKEDNLSSKSVKNIINLISSIFNKAIEWDLLDNNVADKVKIPKNLNKPKKKVILYSYQELDSFTSALSQLKDKELQMAIYTSLNTGARRAEVLGLTFNDIDIERCSIDFNKSKVKVDGGTQTKDTKTGNNRQFYVPRNYINLVIEYYNYLGRPDKSTRLFNMHPDTYTKSFKKFLDKYELREINLKDLRALNESILINKGLDVVSAAKRLGHLPSTATNYYLDQIPEEDKKASEILQDLF